MGGGGGGGVLKSSTEALMFAHKCSQNDVKQHLHECEFFMGGGGGGELGGLRSRHNFAQNVLAGASTSPNWRPSAIFYVVEPPRITTGKALMLEKLFKELSTIF